MYLLITLIKLIFILVTIQMVLFISDILFLCLIFPKYNLSICIVHFKKVLDSTFFVYKCLVTCGLLRVTEHHCCKGDWQQDSASCCVCLLYGLWFQWPPRDVTGGGGAWVPYHVTYPMMHLILSLLPVSRQMPVKTLPSRSGR